MTKTCASMSQNSATIENKTLQWQTGFDMMLNNTPSESQNNCENNSAAKQNHKFPDHAKPCFELFLCFLHCSSVLLGEKTDRLASKCNHFGKEPHINPWQ